MDQDQLIFLLAWGAVAALPGIWLFRDARKRGKSAVWWTVAYGFALVPPRLRFVLVALVFGAWFLTRDQRLDIWNHVPGRDLLNRSVKRRRK